jgi:glycerol-3-phosphate cytidylyltransferase
MLIDETQRELLPAEFAMVDGCFDPLHRGHVEYFRFARMLGVPVLCNLASDSYIRSRKGRPPLLPEADRAAVIAALRFIDYVFINHQGTAWSLEHFRPKYYVKGADWIGTLPSDQVAICRQRQIHIVYANCVLNSSTRILEDFLENRRAG